MKEIPYRCFLYSFNNVPTIEATSLDTPTLGLILHSSRYSPGDILEAFLYSHTYCLDSHSLRDLPFVKW